MITWKTNFQKSLDEGYHDSSDMQGTGYLASSIRFGTGKLYFDNIFDYDSWEYYEGELQGADRMLKTVSCLIQNKIGIDTFIEIYQYIQNQETQILNRYTTSELKLLGLTAEDIHILEVKREYDNRTEQVILGNLLIGKQEIIDEVINIIDVNNFENSDYKKIYEAILDVYNETKQINILSIEQKLKDIVDLEFLVNLTKVAGQEANVKYYIESMKNR